MILAAHQPNFIPPYSYFLKMEVCDVFVILRYAQFSNTGFQNYQQLLGSKWKLEVRKSMLPIMETQYVNGNRMFDLNMHWIMAIAKTLGIDTDKIAYDDPSEEKGTDRLIDLCLMYDCNTYLTNPTAVEKYLDAEAMQEEGIDIMPLDTTEKRHIFDMFNEYGVKKTAEMLKAEAYQIKKHYQEVRGDKR